MNYKIPKPDKNQLLKAVKCLSVVGILFLTIATFLYSPSSSSSLPNCATYSGAKNPGVNCVFKSCADSSVTNPVAGTNCLPNCGSLDVTTTAVPGVNCFYLDMPLCTATSTSVSITDQGITAQPRSNCADSIDLPLCSQIDSNPQPLKNCINECNQATDIIASNHKTTCVRFCDRMPSGMTANPGTNCTYRKCNQLDIGTTPTAAPAAANCTMALCNTLTPDELNESRMQNSSDSNYGQYCDGSSIKCYDFALSQLPYVRWYGDTDSKSMCKIHSCKPSSTACADDTLNITSKGATYTTAYQNNVYFGFDVTSNTSLCNPSSCKTTYYNQYNCTHDSSDTSNPDSLTVRNASCDTTGDGSICATTDCDPNATACLKALGNCYQTVDCNLAANASNSSCTSQGVTEPVDTTVDDTESSFYRPKPKSKAYLNDDPSQDFRTSGTCYSKTDLQDRGWNWGGEVKLTIIPGLPPINFGYFHYELAMPGSAQDKTRSPGYCTSSNVSRLRGSEYPYLCGNGGNVYSKINDQTAYVKGYTSTAFDDNGNSISSITTCLRFKNSLRPSDPKFKDSETCGSRECSIAFSFGSYMGQHCGVDVCRTLQVSSANSKQCAISSGNTSLFNNRVTYDESINGQANCMALIDDYLRLRAVQYSNYVCTFLDASGIAAHNKMFLDGSETMTGLGVLKNGTICFSGYYNPTTGKCDGSKDNNDVPASLSKWRAILQIPYTQGNTAQNGVSGFYMKNGKFIPAQQCAKVALPASPPDLYNLATSNNSLQLFTPPLYIRSVSTVRNGTTAVAADGSSLGTTDFLQPEVTVQFGSTTQKLSLGTGYSGNEASKDPLSIANISTALNGISYSATILLRKEINSATNQPLACLYRRVTSTTGNNDIKVGCVNRSFPEINNIGTLDAASIGVRKISITSNTTNANVLNTTTGKYADSSIILKYCDNTSCSNANSLSFINTDTNAAVCDGVNGDTNEVYKVCAQRDPCSKLYKECFENEISIQNFGMTDAYQAIRSDCKSTAAVCAARKGITSDNNSSFLNQLFATGADSDAYGWFNELCITSGFQSKMKNVYGKNTASGVEGKCLIDTTTSTGSCSNGGNAAQGCNCLDASSGTPVTGYTIRSQTSREAGLCIDIPLPKTCSAINYSGDNYTQTSLGKTSYGSSYTDVTNVNPYHRDRGNGSSSGYAEFPAAIVGMNKVTGTCNGFWKSTGSSGVASSPTMNCLDNSNSTNGLWSGVTANSCIRYSCPAINTGSVNGLDALINGAYSNTSYAASSETVDAPNNITKSGSNLLDTTYGDAIIGNQGASNGYSVWSQIAKTNDFPQAITATNCATGFKKTSSTLPTRNCDQLGNWNAVSNSCQRIYCSAINPPYSPSNASDWQQWYNTNGATFGVETYLINDTANGKYLGAPILYSGSGSEVFSSALGSARTHLTPASRLAASTVSPYVTPGSTRKGYCNNRLGFFQAPNAPQPERDCNSDGTWGAVRNPCVTQCDAITSTSPSSANGNATWPAANQVTIGTDYVATANACIAGYSNYPYNKFKDDSGANFANLPSVTTISPGKPTRTCKSSTVAGGITANVWTAPSSICVNQCPGYDIDPRVNAGVTQHNSKTYGVLKIQWPSTNPGSTAVQTIGYDNGGAPRGIAISSQTAADYNQSNKTSNTPNTSFVVTRYCNANYQWSAPVVQCAANGGNLSNAILGTSNNNTTIASGASISGSTTPSLTCATGYGSPTLPTYQCTTTSGNSNIDQYYYNLTNGTACSQTCPLTNGQLLGSGSSYTGTTPSGNIKYSGDVINLSCRNSSFGKAIVAGSSVSTSGGSDICGKEALLTTTDRISTLPTATCTNGSWIVSNDCSSCRSCSGAASNFLNLTTNYNNYNSCKKGVETYRCTTNIDFNSSCAGNLSSGSSYTCSSSSYCRAKGTLGSCEYNPTASFGVTCLDGLLYLRSSSCSGSGC